MDSGMKLLRSLFDKDGIIIFENNYDGFLSS